MALTKVVTDGIAAGAVTATQIATNAVTVDDISDGSISTAKLANDAVTADKLADTAVTAGTYGSSSAIPSITVDAQGRITAASTNSVTQVGGANGVDFNDSVKARFGTGNDLEILHNGNDSIIDHVGSGHLYITASTDDADVNIRADDGSGGVTTYIQCDGSNGQVELYHYGVEKLQTNSSGVGITGNLTIADTDEPQLILRDSNSNSSAARVQLEARGSDNIVDWFIGHTSTSNNSITFRNEDNQPIYFGTNGSNRVELSADGHWVPQANNTYDLGTSSNRWRNVYTNDLNLSNEGGSNDVDGTWGSWTIQEGEDDLFLLNRRNGKKYKFNLTEVN